MDGDEQLEYAEQVFAAERAELDDDLRELQEKYGSFLRSGMLLDIQLARNTRRILEVLDER